MQKLYKNLQALLVLLFLSTLSAKASTVIGSHIGYRALDSVNYEVTLTLFRNCNSVNPSPIKLGVSSSSGYYETTLTKVSTTDITGAYLKCNFISRCTGSYAYGFEKHIYKDTVSLSTNACTYKFSFKECCRNSAITTGGANTNYYNYAEVNRCAGNNSVQANLEPRLLIPVGQDAFTTSFYGDKLDKQDSVVYSLVDPYEDSVTKISYSGSWSAKKPITFLGFPNAGLNSPAGFEFDESTSDLRFRPTQQNQLSVFCVEAKEYRRINGVMTEIGLTRMDYQVHIISGSNNKTPTLKGGSAVACVGQKTCIDFETDDLDKNDSTFLEFEGLPQGATVSYGRKGNLATAQICYTPTQAAVSTIPYQFTAFVSDNSCDISGRSSSSFTYTVNKAPDSTTIEVKSKTTSCSSADIVVGLKNTTGLTGLTWEIFDEDNLSSSSNDTAKLFFKGSGWKKFYVALKATNTLCTFTLEDSVFITPSYTLNLASKNDSAFCIPQNATIFSNPLNGTAPFSYNWTKENSNFSSTSQQFIENINFVGESKYFLFASDDNGCIGFDSTKITLHPPLTIDAGNYASFCSGIGSVQLKAQVTSGTAPYTYTWQPTNSTTDTVTVSPTTTTSYTLKVEDDNGCISYDSAKVIVAPAISFTPPLATSTCEGVNVNLEATNIIGVAPITFTWDGKPSTEKFTVVNPTQSKAITIEMKDGNGCETARLVQLVVNDNPDVELGPAKTVCRGVPQFIKAAATKGKAPYNYKWSNNITTDSFTTILSSPQVFIVTVTDDNGCIANDNISYQLHPKDNVAVTQLATQCQSGDPVVLKPADGSWSGNGVVVGELFVPQLAGVGVHKLDYNYTSTKNCPESAEMFVKVKPTPITQFTVNKVKGLPGETFNFTNQSIVDTSYTVVWDFGDFGAPGNISLLANPSYTYTKKGKYTVKLTIYDGICDPETEEKDDYIIVDSATVSIPKIDVTTVSVYPNPANTYITIEADYEIAKVAVYDVTGKKVVAQNTAQGSLAHKVNVSTLSNGIYVITVSYENGQKSNHKISITH
jgi:PKD repeat protein